MYYPGRRLNRDDVTTYEEVSCGDGANDEYVQFIKAKWLRDIRLETLISKDGSEVTYSHDNPAFIEDEFYDSPDNQDDFLQDLDTQLYQPRLRNSITDSGVAYDLPSSISEEEHDGNFVLLPKPNQDGGSQRSEDVESATQEVKIDFPDDSSFSSLSSYASDVTMRRTNDVDHFFKSLGQHSTDRTNIT